LTRLNPKASFETAGTKIVVPNVARKPSEAKVEKVAVDKSALTVRALDGVCTVRLKLRRQNDQARSRIDWQAFIPIIRNDHQQCLGPLPPLRRHNTELGHVRP
jgi:hypothetical protein